MTNRSLLKQQKRAKEHQQRRAKQAACDKERLTSAAINELVRHCKKKSQNEYALLALLVLISGRTVSKLFSVKPILIDDNVAQLPIRWNKAQVPESFLPETEYIETSNQEFTLVPQKLASNLSKLQQETDAKACDRQLKAFLTKIRTSTKEHITPITLAKTLGFQKYQFNISVFEWSFLCDEPKNLLGQNSYVAFSAEKLFQKHIKFMAQFIDTAPLERYLTQLKHDVWFGSPRVLTTESVVNTFFHIVNNLNQAISQRTNYERVHNWFTVYTVQLMQLATLHRPISNVFRTLDQFNLRNNNVEIVDKGEESRRLVPLCKVATDALCNYLAYLEKLKDVARFEARNFTSEIDKSLEGKACLFRAWSHSGLTDDYRSLRGLGISELFTKSNWHRHFISTALVSKDYDRYLINTFSGHRLDSQTAYGKSKSFTYDDLLKVSTAIESIITKLDLARAPSVDEYLLGAAL
jgi:hypothetical protein